jgi:hypothetical protein
MIQLKGKIFEGTKGATGSIEKQKPFLNSFIPEISSMKSGTINVQLEFPLLIATYDVETTSIEWEKNRWEKFKFLRAEFQICTPSFGNPVSCLLYYAEKSPYYSNPHIVEVVTKDLTEQKILAKECFIILTSPCWIVAGERKIF